MAVNIIISCGERRRPLAPNQGVCLALQVWIILLQCAALSTGCCFMTRRMVAPIRRLMPAWVIGILLGGLLCSPLAVEAGEGRIYKVKGTVVAVTLNQSPPIIVVNTPLTPKNLMTVGATVTPQTKILRGERKVALQTIKVGETVWLTYVKSPTGLYARIIKVKG
jgi:hypothetical protein